MESDTIEILAREVGMERQTQLRHFESLDARAGFVLGFASVFVVLGAGDRGRPATLVPEMKNDKDHPPARKEREPDATGKEQPADELPPYAPDRSIITDLEKAQGRYAKKKKRRAP